MGLLHVLNADGSNSPWEENQVREMLRSGRLRPETLYRNEGASQWRPLKELPSTPAGAGLRPHYQFTKNPEPLTTIVLILLVVSLLVAFSILFTGIAMLILTLMGDFENGAIAARGMKILAYVSIGIFVLNAIPFLMWIYRANVNCRGFGCKLTFSPGMAAGSYFIPFANLVYPCQAMQEIWKASRNPAQWQSGRASVLVGFWWGFWLLHTVLGWSVSLYSKTHAVGLSDITTKLETVATLVIATETTKIILCLLAFAMIYVITSRQKELVKPAGY